MMELQEIFTNLVKKIILKKIAKTQNIIKRESKAFIEEKEIAYNSNVSINMQEFTPKFIELLKNKKISIKVLEANDK